MKNFLKIPQKTQYPDAGGIVVSKKQQIATEIVESIREELDEHLDAINMNTSEIQASADMIMDLEGKFNKLSEKVDKVLDMLEQQSKPKTQVKPLALREQEIFIALYTEQQFLTYQQIASKVSLPESMVPGIIDAIVAKGIPILKKHEMATVSVQLDNDFRERQTRENMLNINEVVMSSMAGQQ
jgi:hypothetical protein